MHTIYNTQENTNIKNSKIVSNILKLHKVVQQQKLTQLLKPLKSPLSSWISNTISVSWIKYAHTLSLKHKYIYSGQEREIKCHKLT